MSITEHDWTDLKRWRPRIENASFVVGRYMVDCAFNTKHEVLWIKTNEIQLMKPAEVEYCYAREGIGWSG